MIQEREHRNLPYERQGTLTKDQLRERTVAFELAENLQKFFYHRLLLTALVLTGDGQTIDEMLDDPFSDLNPQSRQIEKKWLAQAVKDLASKEYPLVLIKADRIYITEEGHTVYRLMTDMLIPPENEIFQ